VSSASDICILLGLVIFTFVCANIQADYGEEGMNIIFYGSDANKPIPLDVEPVLIRHVSEYPPLPNAEPVPEENGCLRPFANQQLNSRLTAALPDSDWEIMWLAELSEDMPAMFVFRAAGRVVVQQERGWRLFDHRGELVTYGQRGEGHLAIDAENHLFYARDMSGFVSARDLFTGDEKFGLYAALGNGFSHTVWSREGQRIFIISFELPVVSDRGEREPDYTIMEVYDLGTPIEVDIDNVLTSAGCQSVLTSRGVPFLTALHNHTLVMAATDHIFLANENLKITNDFQGEFIPLAMSLDESGRIYLIVHSEDEQRALWVITPEGERIVNVEIPSIADDVYAPPVIGYDHRVYIMLGDRVMAISPEGETLWQQHAGGTIAGAFVTADNQLLVSAGSILYAFDDQGERRILCYFADETLLTPPILTERGRLLVASDRHIYCLRPKQ